MPSMINQKRIFDSKFYMSVKQGSDVKKSLCDVDFSPHGKEVVLLVMTKKFICNCNWRWIQLSLSHSTSLTVPYTDGVYGIPEFSDGITK